MRIVRRQPPPTGRQILARLGWTLVVAANVVGTVITWTFINQQQRDADKSIVGDLFGQVALVTWAALEITIIALLAALEIRQARSKA